MNFTDLLVAQLTDPFRIGLLAALVVTTIQTAANTGRVLPLLAGLVFVAVLIPMTTGNGEVTTMFAVGAGVVANAIILAVMLGLLFAWNRISGSRIGE